MFCVVPVRLDCFSSLALCGGCRGDGGSGGAGDDGVEEVVEEGLLLESG